MRNLISRKEGKGLLFVNGNFLLRKSKKLIVKTITSVKSFVRWPDIK